MKLIFLDIDGTLTYGGSDVPPASALEAIRKTQERGNLVFLCTGRNYFLVEPFLKYRFDGVVGSAGSYVRIGDEVLLDQPLEAGLVDTAVEILHRSGVFCMLETQAANYSDVTIRNLVGKETSGNSEMERFRAKLFARNFMVPMEKYDGRPVYKIVGMFTDLSQIEEAQRLLKGKFDFAVMGLRPGQTVRNMELINPVFNKGYAIRMLTAYYHVDMADTYGFGDSMNDLSMLQTVGTSVCMENGDEKLKQCSDLIAPRADKDGLYSSFMELGLFN